MPPADGIEPRIGPFVHQAFHRMGQGVDPGGGGDPGGMEMVKPGSTMESPGNRKGSRGSIYPCPPKPQTFWRLHFPYPEVLVGMRIFFREG